MQPWGIQDTHTGETEPLETCASLEQKLEAAFQKSLDIYV